LNWQEREKELLSAFTRVKKLAQKEMFGYFAK